MAFTIIVCAFVITFITERISISKVEKYEFKEEKREVRLGKREYRGPAGSGRRHPGTWWFWRPGHRRHDPGLSVCQGKGYSLPGYLSGYAGVGD